MSKLREEENKNIKQKPKLQVDSQENPRLTDFKNLSEDKQQQAQLFNQEQALQRHPTQAQGRLILYIDLIANFIIFLFFPIKTNEPIILFSSNQVQKIKRNYKNQIFTIMPSLKNKYRRNKAKQHEEQENIYLEPKQGEKPINLQQKTGDNFEAQKDIREQSETMKEIQNRPIIE